MATITQIAKVKRDASSASVLLTDAQIADIIDENGGIHEYAVAQCFDILASDASSKGTIQIGKYKESFFEQAKSYERTAALWRRKVVRAKPFAGGISKADIESRNLDTDRNAPIFKKGLDNNAE